MAARPHRVALTGGIATGKSYVANRLRDAGVPVVDADQLSHDAVKPGTEALELVRLRFGPEAIAPSGEMNRRHVGDVVFRDKDARRDLEAIIHPRVRHGIEEFFNSLPASVPFAIADIPLLYETGRANDFEGVVVVACGLEAQIARVMARGATREDAERRIQAQLSVEDKAARADYVIRTDGTHAQTDNAVIALVATLRQRWA